MPTDAQLRLEGVYKVIEWMEVMNREAGRTFDTTGIKCDLDHSALIHWLCRGNSPLADRPPVRFSRPDHQAAIDGRFKPVQVAAWGDPPYLIVDQEAWQILEQLAPEAWTAAYRQGRDAEGKARWSAPWSVRRERAVWVAERLP